MKDWKYIKYVQEKVRATIILDRPDTHNSFHITMIRELSDAIDYFSAQPELRILLFRSSGKYFSSGADLNWMKDGMNLSGDKLFSESLELAELFRKIYESQLVTIALTEGVVMGGANGIIAACDFCLAEEHTVFGLTEVRLGLLPATISPYIIRKTGIARAGELMLTGKIINAKEAKEAGLVSEIYCDGEAEQTLENLVTTLLSNGPEALKGVKSLLRSIEHREIDRDLSRGTADVIARFRKSVEGREGINAFLEKRKPSWIDNE